MVTLDLGREFDVVTCLFSSIGYVVTRERLRAAAASLARHVAPGGLLVVEPWITPGGRGHPTTSARVFVDEPDLKIARMNAHAATLAGETVTLDFQYLVGTPDGRRALHRATRARDVHERASTSTRSRRRASRPSGSTAG